MGHWWKNHGQNNPSVTYEIANIFVNIVYFIFVWFKSILFSYYTGILCLAIQFSGFYYNMIYQDKTSKLNPYPLDLAESIPIDL